MTDDIVGDYYRRTALQEAKRLNRGQICWGPGLYLRSHLDTASPASIDPTDERRNRYAILPNTPEDVVFDHTPIMEIGLQHDEELLVIKAKRRPFVVISQSPMPWAPGGQRLQERGYLCLPMYSFHSDDGPQLRTRVRALEYASWIYLPEESRFSMKEGFLRLDRAQVITDALLDPRQSSDRGRTVVCFRVAPLLRD